MKVLLIVDIQNDFLPGGSLAVKEGDQIIPVVNGLMPKFELVIATQDWHPPSHGSFASNHEGKKPGDQIVLNGLDQILWPDHCVQNTHGADFAENLDSNHFEKIFRKGTDVDIDSYSGFFDNGHLKDTGLADYLKKEGVRQVFIVGLATDYCVKFTALDSVERGFETFIIQDATRAVNLQPNDFDLAISEMRRAGIRILDSAGVK